MPTDIEGLRQRLFETIDALKREDKPMDIERAKAISEAAQVIVNSAKVECEHMKLTGSIGSGFLPVTKETPVPGVPRLVKGRSQSGSSD